MQILELGSTCSFAITCTGISFLLLSPPFLSRINSVLCCVVSVDGNVCHSACLQTECVGSRRVLRVHLDSLQLRLSFGGRSRQSTSPQQVSPALHHSLYSLNYSLSPSNSSSFAQSFPFFVLPFVLEDGRCHQVSNRDNPQLLPSVKGSQVSQGLFSSLFIASEHACLSNVYSESAYFLPLGTSRCLEFEVCLCSVLVHLLVHVINESQI